MAMTATEAEAWDAYQRMEIAWIEHEHRRALEASTVTGIGVSSIGTGAGGFTTTIDPNTFLHAAVGSTAPSFRADDTSGRELQHVVFSTPIQVLLDAWGQRYGDEWVNREQVLKDEFFGIAYKRLKKLGRIEVHFLIDRNEHVCRKVPDEHL